MADQRQVGEGDGQRAVGREGRGGKHGDRRRRRRWRQDWSTSNPTSTCERSARRRGGADGVPGDASLIVVFSHTGETTRLVAKYHLQCPVLSLSIPVVHGGTVKGRWRVTPRRGSSWCIAGSSRSAPHRRERGRDGARRATTRRHADGRRGAHESHAARAHTPGRTRRLLSAHRGLSTVKVVEPRVCPSPPRRRLAAGLEKFLTSDGHARGSLQSLHGAHRHGGRPAGAARVRWRRDRLVMDRSRRDAQGSRRGVDRPTCPSPQPNRQVTVSPLMRDG